MLKRQLISLLICAFGILCMPASVWASHIVGGEVSYKCAGGNNYTITLMIYQDCLTGYQDAIAGDNPALIGVFDKTTSLGTVYEVNGVRDTIKANIPSICVDNYPATCLTRVTFTFQTTLAVNTGGYRIVYVRCCRNGTVLNLNNPGETGVTFFADIPPSSEAPCNNSASFNRFPPQIICVNNPLVYDHSAIDDTDGDSLSYEFCTAYDGGAPTNSKPDPTANIAPPVKYAGGFSAIKPMIGNPAIQINPKTGLITGTPTIQGRYVVTVCCHEWRNGVKINTISRDFQFVVANCSKNVTANIPQLSDEPNTYIVQCKGLKVKFLNKSVGAFNYSWEFGVPGATSQEFEPEYTYPDTGTYTVKLTINKNSECEDQIERIVKVYPDYTAAFDYDGYLCPNTPLQFNDNSVATFPPVVAWNWNFGDGNTATGENPVHTFPVGGTYKVQLISRSAKGCVDTVVRDVLIEGFKPFAGNDTIIVKGELINFDAKGGIEYLWTPPTNLDFANSANPTGRYPDTGTFQYNVHIKSASGCEGDDSIKVWVVNQASLFVPNAFSPNGDGKNDIFRPIGVGYAEVRFFRVFNRWGQLMFDSKNFKDGWDGTFNGQPLELGVYYWVCGVKDRFGKDELVKGDVTLIR